jgi:LPXTG-site transpeptidase (sortase) family protein
VQRLQRSVSKTSKKPVNRLDSLIPSKLRGPVLLISIGIFLMALGGINYYRVRILSFSKTPTSASETPSFKGIAPEKITIPSAKIDLSIEKGAITNGVWEISPNNATFLNTSAGIGAGGNTVIYGHNKKAIFGNLPYVKIGEKVIITDAEGKNHEYEVYSKVFVGPDRVDLVSPTGTEEVTIYTCWGIFDSQRVVIKAKRV